MTKAIILLIAHISCAICWAICSIIMDRKPLRITSIICTMLWSICIGIDIAQLTLM